MIRTGRITNEAHASPARKTAAARRRAAGARSERAAHCGARRSLARGVGIAAASSTQLEAYGAGGRARRARSEAAASVPRCARHVAQVGGLVTLGAVETLSATERASLADAVVKLEAYMQGPAATAIARRYLFWQSLRNSAAQYGISPSDVVSDALVSANTLADRNAQSYARLLSGLSSGELKLAAWTPQGESSQPMQLGIVRADVQPSALGQWQFLPIVARVVGQVVIAAGAWVLANAWTTSRELEAQADKRSEERRVG